MNKWVLFYALCLSQIGLAQDKNDKITEDVASSERIWVDIRTLDEYQDGTIGNAIHIDFYSEEFVEKIKQLDSSKEIIIFCKAGSRSKEAYELLQKEGLTNIKEFEGGYDAYQSKSEQ